MNLYNSTYLRKLCIASSLVIALSLLAACGEHGHDGHEEHNATPKDETTDHHSAGTEAGSHDQHSDGKNSDEGHGDAGHHGDEEYTTGEPGMAAEVTRTIEIAMNDQMRFVPDSFSVRAGETIKFNLTNDGAVPHEMVIGDAEYLVEHSEMMKKFPGMEHEEPNMLKLEAAKSGELIWKFTKTGKIDFACLQPGHYDAGMKGLVTVASH